MEALGDDIYVSGDISEVKISESYFKNLLGSQAIYLEKSTFSIEKSSFEERGSGTALSFGGALYCVDCKEIHISESSF